MKKIKVTQEDIDYGQPKHCNNCPIARALSRELGSPCEVMPNIHDQSEAYINHYTFDGEVKKYTLPFEANVFANEFDKQEYVEPFEFELNQDEQNIHRSIRIS